MSTDPLTEFFSKAEEEDDGPTKELTEMMSEKYNMSSGVLISMRRITNTGDQAIVLVQVLLRHQYYSGSRWLSYSLDNWAGELGITKRQLSRVLAQLTSQGKLVSREPDEEEEARHRKYFDWEEIVMVRPEFEEIERCVKERER